MNKDFNRWEFIEKWLPNYSSDQDVAWSNDLSKYLAENTTIKTRMTEAVSML